jgi:hypothetical protein
MRMTVILAAVFCMVATAAATVLEQQTDKGNSWVVLDPGEEAAQTFTNTSGSTVRIDTVRVWLSQAFDKSTNHDGDLVVEIQGVNVSGEPDSNVVWTETIDMSNEYGDFSAAILEERVVNPNPALELDPGESLALVLRVTGGTYNYTRVLWGGSDTDAYTGGEAFGFQLETSTWEPYQDYDIDRYFVVLTDP